MAITRRNFLKGLGGGMASLGLAEAVCQSPSWAYTVPTTKIKQATETTSICPYCGVGCGLIAHSSNNQLINVEGDPDHPINQGTLCSKGQAVFQIINNDRRLKKSATGPLEATAGKKRTWIGPCKPWRNGLKPPGMPVLWPSRLKASPSTAPRRWPPSAAPPLTTKNAILFPSSCVPWASSTWNIRPASDTPPPWPRWGRPSVGVP